MKRRFFNILFVLCVIQNAHAVFEYDRGVSAAQRGAWDDAQKLLTTALVNAPDDPNLAYDMGVTAYKKTDYDYAADCFKAAASNEHASAHLKERAHFNLGNTYAQQHNYEETVKEYDAVLALNPQNEHARHNKELIEKKLSEQKKQEQRNDQQQDQQKKEQDKKNQQDNQQQDKKQKNSDDDQKDGNDSDADRDEESESQQSPDGESGKQSGKQKDKHESKDDGANAGQNQGDDRQKGNKSDDDDHAGGASEREREQTRRESEKQKRDAEQKRQHEKDSRKRELDQEKNELEQQQQAGADKGKHTTPQDNQLNDSQCTADDKNGQKPDLKALPVNMQQALEAREKRDAQMNKAMIKARVGKQMTGRHGQQCW